MKNKIITPIVIIGVLIYLMIEARNRGDFFIYLSASRDLFQGKDIFSVDYVDGYYYLYSVLFAALIYPLSFLPAYAGQLIWLLLNAFFLYRIIKIIASYFDSSLLSHRQRWLLFILGFAFALRFILGNFHYMQITICILYLALEGVQLIFSGKKLAGAILIALGINIKILPIVLLPYLIYRREFKASAFVVVSCAAMEMIPAIVIGFERNNVLLVSWWHHVNPMNSQQILDVDERSFHGLSTLLATLLVEKAPDLHALPIKRNIANISLEQLTYVLNITRLFLISLSLYVFHSKPFTSQPNKIKRYREISYLLLLVPLIFPHQQHYAFLFTAPAMCYMFYYIISEKDNLTTLKFWSLVICSAIVYLTANLTLLLGVFNDYYEHFKILTYGAILIIPMLVLCAPKNADFQAATS